MMTGRIFRLVSISSNGPSVLNDTNGSYTIITIMFQKADGTYSP